ncbi:MAG: phosphoribosylglycinamide formyltransferase [Clostridiales bacterium]|nr:phosphoribosylglycinamide formyltransferase [Clostridiales bacterium]
MSVRAAVLVSGGGTNLQALIDAAATGSLKSAEIALVLSNKGGAHALERAKNAGIEAVCCEREKGESRDDHERRMLEILRARNVDMLVLAGFLSILSPAFVRAFPDRIVNVHPSLIPAFCGKGFYGLKVHEAALACGVKLTGATVHLVNEIPDGGRILLQKAVEVLPGDTPEVLQRRVMEQAEWVLLPRAVEMVARQIQEELR